MANIPNDAGASEVGATPFVVAFVLRQKQKQKMEKKKKTNNFHFVGNPYFDSYMCNAWSRLSFGGSNSKKEPHPNDFDQKLLAPQTPK